MGVFHRGDSNYLLELPEPNNGITYDSSYLDDSSSLECHRSIIEYVVNWRHNPLLRHPSLRSDQPAQLSLNYLQDVYRLCGMDATGDTVDRLATHMAVEVAQFTGNVNTERK